MGHEGASEGTAPAGRRGRGVRAGLRRHGLRARPEEVRSAVGGGPRFTEGNRVAVFETGRPALRAMLEAIDGARRYVHLETYILRSDATGARFVEALLDRALDGVSVRLLYDAFGSLGIDEGFLRPLREAGADVVAFNPVSRIYPRWAPRRRDHRKLLLVDGRIAFVGGLNIGDEYWGGDTPESAWRDAHLALEGPVVRELGAVFLESWFRADGPDIDWHDLMSTESAAVGDVRCAVVPDGPVYRRRRTRDLLMRGLREAREQVCLASPYFAPGRRVLRAVAECGRRASVVLVLAGRTDHPVLRRAAHALLPRLLRSGVEVFEYEASMMHAKVAIFDRQWAVVGSSNLDRQSFDHSYEVNVVLEGDVVARLHETFVHAAAHSLRVDEDMLAGRSLWERWLDRASAIVLRFI